MTAEIAIMNKYGVALAADSAASIATSLGHTKIYDANKVFMLSKHRPVGVMVNGNSELMSVPWETIIKVYRKQLKDRSFKTLREYSGDFLTFLKTDTLLFPPAEQETYVYGAVYRTFHEIKEKFIDREVEAKAHKGLKVSAAAINKIVVDKVRGSFRFFTKLAVLPNVPPKFEKDVLAKYFQLIEQAIDDVFGKFKLSTATRKSLRRIAVALFARDTFQVEDMSGNRLLGSSEIIVAGFGDDELYPDLVSYEIEGVTNDTLIYKEGVDHKVTSIDSAVIIPFAQKEMVFTFMEGIAPNYRAKLGQALRALFKLYPDKLIKQMPGLTQAQRRKIIEALKKTGGTLASTFEDTLVQWARATNVNPILRTVAVLPIDELAIMAEALVNLTSFKRRVTLVPETVRGPIDVAVISKGDGFIWIKRKHYFESDDNPHFLKTSLG